MDATDRRGEKAKMSKQIEFYFDFGSPYSYLAQTQFNKLAADTKATIVYMPINVLELMKATGNTPTTLECKSKRKYAKNDLQRWVKKYGIGWEPNHNFRHIDLNFLLRGAIAAIKLGVGAHFVSKVFDGLYAQALDLGDVGILTDFLNKNELPADNIIEMMARPEIFDELKARNKAAEDAGLFGTPTFRVGEEIFFGNDRLSFVEAAAKTQA
ncbi:2-hydroxychromene-2-carboxylate isomerase [Bradyrhizobium canariense]|uniref:2-hydroxychromene-2-carboxylate isomerase n=1 Tax=Bradyrhizobium canariense TaxID=255045 RepID=UPI001B89DFB3|nr:2-hydroxychromene-2-carboxylate isomerase [Bradyrhizobium canariense]MBR0954908.1 2-hydroxychromene-2-carboxylate isomerase [Bradyrhizobium canariense]